MLSIAERFKLAVMGLARLKSDKNAQITGTVAALCTWADETSDANQARARAAVVNTLTVEALSISSNNLSERLNQANITAIVTKVREWISSSLRVFLPEASK